MSPRLLAGCLLGCSLVCGFGAASLHATEGVDAAMTEAAAGDSLHRFDELWNHDDPAGTERKFRALLPAAEAAADRAVLLQLRTQIARTLGLQKCYEEAHALLDEVEPELEAAPPVVRVRYLLERGRVLRTSGRRDEARSLFEEAWRVGREAGTDGFAVDAAHMMAITTDPPESILWSERALELARSSSDERARNWRGSLLNNLGWTRHDLGEFEEARALFVEALEARREQGDAAAVRIARWCVARADRSLGRLEEALRAQRELHAELEAAGANDGYVAEEIAECLLALGKAEEARPWFARAHEILSQDPWLPEGEPERLERLRRLGERGP